MAKLKSYRVTRIDPELWAKFKSACAYYDIDIREIFIKYMQAIVTDYEWALSHKVDVKTVQAIDLFRLRLQANEREKWPKMLKKKGGKKA